MLDSFIIATDGIWTLDPMHIATMGLVTIEEEIIYVPETTRIPMVSGGWGTQKTIKKKKKITVTLLLNGKTHTKTVTVEDIKLKVKNISVKFAPNSSKPKIRIIF